MASSRHHSFSERHHSHHHTSPKYCDYPDHSPEHIPQSYGSRQPILLEREETPRECETCRRRRRDEKLRRAEDRVQQQGLTTFVIRRMPEELALTTWAPGWSLWAVVS